MDRASDLRADYNHLGSLLAAETDGSKAAALSRERRALSDILEGLEIPEEVSLVDELAKRRKPAAKDSVTPSRRRKSR